MSEDSEAKEYTLGDLTVMWDAAKCRHTGRCVHGLPSVFDTKQRPWINLLGATPEEIRAQVAQCPSGALSLKDEA